MSVADRLVLAQLFSAEGNFDNVSIEDQRARFDALADLFPQSGDVYSAEQSKVGGIDGEWVRTRASLADAALLYLHGGGYSIGSPKSHRHMVGALCVESGLPSFVAGYRLAPEHRFPAALDDAVAAYRGLLESGIAASRLAIAGDSAGGGLTVATLVAARTQGLPMPACAVAISPWCDLGQGGEAFRARAKRDPIVSKDGLDSLAKAYLGDVDPKTPLASPLFADLKGLPPLLIQVGTEEALHEDAVRLRARAEEAGVEVSAESWGGMIHVWHIFHPILSEGRDAIARAGRFLKSRIA
jgi:monoterpene epsilon-lactone hydrolase